MAHGPTPQNLLVRIPPENTSQYRRFGFWKDLTIYDYAERHAAADPSKIAVRDSHSHLSYQELVMLSDALAEDLAASGVSAGDRVAAWFSSRIEVAVFLLACSRNGYVFSPSLHLNHTVEETKVLLGRMGAKAFAVEEGYGSDSRTNDIFAAASELDHTIRVYRLPRSRKRTYSDIFKSLGLTSRSQNHSSGGADNVVYLAFTSGTTAEPKGVMHSNNTLLANARSIAGDWEFDSRSVIYTLSPPSHNLGFGALILAMLVGGEIIFHDLPRGASLLEKLNEAAVTFIFGVPAHAADLLSELQQAGGANLESLAGFRISGAATPPSAIEGLLSYGVRLRSGYGMTEACSHHYTLPADSAELIVGTSGRACPSYEIEIFSLEDPDRPLAPGEIGHIGGRGASLMLGYFNDQLTTESAFNKSGWFMTQDIGRVDQNGYLQITGRIKDIIIRGGHNIHPAKIEALAMRHPGVARAAAVAVKDERLGERVCIVVMPKDGNTIDPTDLLSHLHREGLSKYDMPEYFLQVDEIPLSPNGKILKRALTPPLAAGELVPQSVRWRA
jgi:acyl-CoA synthetase (AMP-forming)/AMP-acid ligase II